MKTRDVSVSVILFRVLCQQLRLLQRAQPKFPVSACLRMFCFVFGWLRSDLGLLLALLCVTVMRYFCAKEMGDDGEVEAMVESKVSVGILVDSGTHEKTLRTVINGVALLVGLTWDLAFEASNEVIVEGSSFSRTDLVLEIKVPTEDLRLYWSGHVSRR